MDVLVAELTTVRVTFRTAILLLIVPELKFVPVIVNAGSRSPNRWGKFCYRRCSD